MACSKLGLTEKMMIPQLQKLKLEEKLGVAEKYIPPPFPKPNATEEEKVEVAKKKDVYMRNIKHAFTSYAEEGLDSDVYLVLQPIFLMSRSGYKLVGLEILARVKNGKDAAPMPGLSQWQVEDREGAMVFLKKQFDFARSVAGRFPDVDISVNVRPDELAGAKEKILEVARGCKNLLVEITEYAPITEEVIALITDMKRQGTRFALDDVTKVVDAPSNGYAKTGAHSCSFEIAKQHAELFEVQKLSLPMSCVAYRVKVFPTPEFAGGEPVAFLEKQIIEHTAGSPISEAILERKREIESWAREVKAKKPGVRFVIECSLHEEDLIGKEGLIPDLDLFDGSFCTQGGRFGGRGFSPEALLACEAAEPR